MVLRLVFKRGLLPMSVRSFLLNVVAFAGVSCILALGIRILAPLNAMRSGLVTPNLIPDRSFIVLSVDDFGRWTDSVPLFPSTDFMNNHSQLIINNNFWYRRATVESHTDLQNLKTSLTRLNQNVSFEQRAVLTPHWIVGGPDFEAMRVAGCGVDSPPGMVRAVAVDDHFRDLSKIGQAQGESGTGSEAAAENQTERLSAEAERRSGGTDDVIEEGASGDYEGCVYKEQLLSDKGATGLDQAPYYRGDLKDIYTDLWTSGLWHPEYHGRSHFSVSKWMRLLRTDKKAQACFENNLVCATDTTQLRSEFNGFQSKAALKTWLEEGVNAFAAFWGYRPALISSPHNTWSSWLTDAAVDLSFTGAELAEDQANYIQHDDKLSLHDRYRFDVFFPGFNCEKAISEVEELLRVPVEKSLADRWYDFLSMIDLFRVHHRPYHHGSGGDHERFISLMWHAQNAMSSTYSVEEHSEHMQCLEKVVARVRESTPRAVFLTGSELHQIRRDGHSLEIWSDSIILRNYGRNAMSRIVPDLRDLLPRSASWMGKRVLAKRLSLKGERPDPTDSTEQRYFQVGDEIRLESDEVIQLSSV